MARQVRYHIWPEGCTLSLVGFVRSCAVRSSAHRVAFVSLFDLIEVCRAALRVEILLALREGGRGVGEIARARELSQSHVSHHLQILGGAGLVGFSAAGQRHVYSLGVQASVTKARGGLLLSLRGDDGSAVHLEIPASLATELGAATLDPIAEFALAANSAEPPASARRGAAAPGRTAQGRNQGPRN